MEHIKSIIKKVYNNLSESFWKYPKEELEFYQNEKKLFPNNLEYQQYLNEKIGEMVDEKSADVRKTG